MDGYPVQPAKVQRPLLRDETLARDRLLDWLNVKIHHRVVFVTAEAGYGKTTLLADFSRRTRLRTLWYRLDDEDRNWISFLSYLVAAGREHDPDFAPMTLSLLRETGATGPSPESVIETFVREFQVLGDLGAVLIFDDLHVVDDAPDVRQILGILLERAPERVTFVFSSRRRPSLRVARLRGRGEVAELTTDDLRFSGSETEQLFRETYGQPLEPDVLDDLSRRTEGWAASLQLVQAALRDRTASQIRTFVRSLSGAEGDLYDYFAEEVVGDLDEGLQDFLMRTSILETVEPELARIVTKAAADRIQQYIEDSERLGLLSRRGNAGRPVKRFHPLVREFLEDRLRSSIGLDGIRELHLRVADHARSIGEWRLACNHYAEAGDLGQLEEVLGESVQQIMGSGQYALANAFLERYPSLGNHPTFDIIRSRMAYRRGAWAEAQRLAARAVEAAPGSDDAVTNLLSLHFLTGNVDKASDLASSLATRGTDPLRRRMASAMLSAAHASGDGDLSATAAEFRDLAADLETKGYSHFEGIALLNEAEMKRAIGDAAGVVEAATRAIDRLEQSAVEGEAATAHLLRAWAFAHLNNWQRATADLAWIDLVTIPSIRSECRITAAQIHVWYGDVEVARDLLEQAEKTATRLPDQYIDWHLVSAETALRDSNVSRAREHLQHVHGDRLSTVPGRRLQIFALQIVYALMAGNPTGDLLEEAARLADRQKSDLFELLFRLLRAAGDRDTQWDAGLAHVLHADPAIATMVATIVGSRLHLLSPETFSLVEQEASNRPVPWRTSLRPIADDRASPSRVRAGEILDVMGSAEDVPRLRSIARTSRTTAHLGKNLARTLASHVTVEDLGRVHIRIDDRSVPGTTVRRKVLACLVFLASRPQFSATRDQVLDALWPDLPPAIAVNSLNQTVYFLRRVFEPEYKEDLSPEYVHHDSDVLWLDPELVRSRSAECWSLIRRLPAPANPEDVLTLCELYSGRFALDFAYEEWAVAYREALHAAYLQVVETAVSGDMQSGHFDRGVLIARRALEVDPDAEQIELSLLRLYRRTGAHAAAAEQYGHYAGILRNELGIDPPPLESL